MNLQMMHQPPAHFRLLATKRQDFATKADLRTWRLCILRSGATLIVRSSRRCYPPGAVAETLKVPVLVVSRDRALMNRLIPMFVEHHCPVVPVSSTESALEQLRQHPYGLLLVGK